MIALRRDSGRSAEAALKYFVLGALASGLLLYGISMVYGATGSLDFASVLASAFNEQANEWLLKLGMVFIVVAIAFKLGAVPFHMWVPDVYDGAPTSVTAFVGTAPKIAAVVFAFRILVTGMGTIHSDWAPMLAILAVASLVVGNLAAIMQTNIKRMLAYSTVSHMGFILLAFMAGAVGFTAGLYYAITYALMAAVSFGVLMVLSTKDIECETSKTSQALTNAMHGCLPDVAVYVLHGGYSTADGFLRQIRSDYGTLETRPCLVVRICRHHVADWCVLLPARGQSHLLRCS